jgi:hypothetical protein
MAERALVHYCWHCYAANANPAAACQACGRPVETPGDATYAERLIWALGHPLPDTRMIAAEILGTRREPAAAPRLRQLVASDDPYLAAQALKSLVAIVGVDATRETLVELAHSGAPPVAAVASRALRAAQNRSNS